VAIVASTLEVGGAERVAASLVERLPDDIETAVCCLRRAGAIGRDMFRAGAAGMERLEHFRGDPAALIRFVRFLEGYRPHVVYCLDHHNAMFAGRVARLCGKTGACVVASHATGLVGRRSSLRWTDRWLLDFTERVVALSPAHARYLCERESIDAGRVTIIENGVDTNAFIPATDAIRQLVRAEEGIDATSPVALMVAAMRPEKAHTVALEAVGSVIECFPGVKVLFAGGGPGRAALEESVRRQGLRNAVHFLGVRDDVARLLHAADVLILPSRDVVETLPLSVMEAMASGLPVIASAVGSLRDLVIPGRTGWLIAPAHAGELARAMVECFGDRPRAQRMGAAARAYVEQRYTVERMVRQYARLFRDLAVT